MAGQVSSLASIICLKFPGLALYTKDAAIDTAFIHATVMFVIST